MTCETAVHSIEAWVSPHHSTFVKATRGLLQKCLVHSISPAAYVRHEPRVKAGILKTDVPTGRRQEGVSKASHEPATQAEMGLHRNPWLKTEGGSRPEEGGLSLPGNDRAWLASSLPSTGRLAGRRQGLAPSKPEALWRALQPTSPSLVRVADHVTLAAQLAKQGQH